MRRHTREAEASPTDPTNKRHRYYAAFDMFSLAGSMRRHTREAEASPTDPTNKRHRYYAAFDLPSPRASAISRVMVLRATSREK